MFAALTTVVIATATMKIGFIGAGKMAQALCRGLVKSGKNLLFNLLTFFFLKFFFFDCSEYKAFYSNNNNNNSI